MFWQTNASAINTKATYHIVHIENDGLPIAAARGQQLFAAVVFWHAQATGKGQITWKTVGEHCCVVCVFLCVCVVWLRSRRDGFWCLCDTIN